MCALVGVLNVVRVV